MTHWYWCFTYDIDYSRYRLLLYLYIGIPNSGMLSKIARFLSELVCVPCRSPTFGLHFCACGAYLRTHVPYCLLRCVPYRVCTQCYTQYGTRTRCTRVHDRVALCPRAPSPRSEVRFTYRTALFSFTDHTAPALHTQGFAFFYSHFACENPF